MDRFLKSNNALRILAILLSIALWLMVNAPTDSGTASAAGVTERFPFTVQVQTSPDTVVSSLNTSTAVLAVTGDPYNLMSLSADMKNVVITANATGLTPGQHTLALQVVNLPQNLNSLSYTVQPQSITVTLERRANDQRAVQVNVQGHPASGYMLGTASSDVQEVHVSGSSATVAKVSAVVANVSIEGATKPLHQLMPLTPVDANGKKVDGVQVEPAEAMVTVPVEAPTYTANVIAQLVGSPAAGYAVAGVSISPNSVSVFGQSNSKSAPTNITVPVDISGVHESTTMHVQLPLGPDMVRLNPATVAVTVQVEESVSNFMTDVPIQVRNVPSGESVTINGTKTVDISVSGPKSIVSQMKPGDVTAYIDATHLGPNDKQAPLQVVLPNWLEVSELSVHQVPVTVTNTAGLK